VKSSQSHKTISSADKENSKLFQIRKPKNAQTKKSQAYYTPTALIKKHHT